MNEIGEWIQNIAVYLIISAAILHAVPENGYRKYIRFFTGLVLILLLAGQDRRPGGGAACAPPGRASQRTRFY